MQRFELGKECESGQIGELAAALQREVFQAGPIELRGEGGETHATIELEPL